MNNSAARRYPLRAGKDQLDPNSGTNPRLTNGTWNFALSPAIDKVTVCQQSSSAADGRTLHGGDQRLIKVEQRIL